MTFEEFIASDDISARLIRSMDDGGTGIAMRAARLAWHAASVESAFSAIDSHLKIMRAANLPLGTEPQS
jgi:hypothetical protein